jgi:hypothetical protein
MRPPAQADESRVPFPHKSFPPQSQGGTADAATPTDQARILGFGIELNPDPAAAKLFLSAIHGAGIYIGSLKE